MRRLHTADWRSRTATARLPGVLAWTLPDAKAFAMSVLGRHSNNFAEHRSSSPLTADRPLSPWRCGGFVGEFHEPAKRLIHIENQKNCSGDRKGTYAQCRHRDEVPGRKKPEASE